MLPESTRNIIFDLGGVFIDVDYSKTRKAFQSLGIKDFDSYFTQDSSTSLFRELEIGKLEPKEFYSRFRTETKLNPSDDQIRDAWNAMLGEWFIDQLDYCEKLSYRIFLFSNTNIIHHDFFIDSLANRKSLDQVYYSHTLGQRKPDPESFLTILSENGLDPTETVFIDDSLQNVKAAQTVGIHGIYLQPPEKEANAFLVGNGRERILIDTGTGHQMFIPLLQQTLSAEKAIVKMVLITHQHQAHFNGFNLSEYSVFGINKHKKYPHMQILKDGQVFKADGATIKAVSTPGHCPDHASYFLREEDCLFSGDSLVARLTNNDTRYLYSNLTDFKKSISKQSSLYPKLCLQGHGEISINAYQLLDNSLQDVRNVDKLITELLLQNGSLTTKLLIEKYSQSRGITKQSDLLVLAGMIRVHLDQLEKDGIIVKRNVAYDTYGKADGTIKGPGGLEMTKIFSLIQESRKKDYESQLGYKEKLDLHSIHSDYQIPSNTTWTLK
ncbi:hypothetical protein HDV04_004772 [Boothiomyces sp. JEL0838]|nr:hypothetical protein HDV04_004772 [Boothiomyces sp. JEL0838]